MSVVKKNELFICTIHSFAPEKKIFLEIPHPDLMFISNVV